MQHYNALVKVTSISFSNFIFLLEFFNLYDFRLNMGGAVGGVGDSVPPTFGTSGVQWGTGGSGPMKMIFASTSDSLYSVLYK